MLSTISDTKGLEQARAALADLDKSAVTSGKTLAGVGEGIAKLTTTAAVGAVAGLAVGLGAAVKSAGDFEAAISGIKAVAGDAGGDIGALRQTALDLGAATKFSATEAAVGMEELIKAGVSMTDVMGGGARAALDLAAAGEVSVGEAATITSNALNAFSLSGDEAAAVADVIAGAANASAIDVHEFGFSLAASGAVAATVGLSFNDLAEGIAIMGQAGIKGSDAGTSLKTMLLNLQPVTDKQVSLFHELGLITEESGNRFFDATGRIKSMAEIAQVLQDALGGMSEQQRLASLEVLFGSDAIRAGAVLTKAGAAGFNEMAAAMGKVSAQQVAEERLNNVQGSLEKLKGSLETAAIVIGSAFLPVLKQMIDAATEAVNQGLPQMQEMAQGIADGFTTAIPHVVTFFSLLSEHGDTIKIVAGALASLAVIVTVTGWITGAIAAFSALGATIAASSGIIVGIVAILGGPITVVVFAIVAAVVLLAAAWATNFGDIQGKTAAVVSFLVSAFQTVMQAVTNVAATLNAWNTAIVSALNAANLAIVGFLNTLGVAWTAGWAALTATLTAAWAAIQIAIDLAMAAINLAITLALGLWWLAFVQPLIDIYTLVTTTFTSIMTWLNEMFWLPLVTVFTTQLAALTLLITITWTTISTTTMTIWTAMSVYFMDTFWNPLAALVTTVTAAILQVITTVWTEISAVTLSVWNELAEFFVNVFWNPLAALVTTTTAAILRVIAAAWTAIQSITESVWNALLGLLASIFSEIHAEAKASIDPIPGIFSAAWNAVKSGISGTLAAAGKTAEGIFNAIVKAADKARKAIEKFIEAVGDAAGKIPGIFKPGSPPPLAVGFDFITDSIRNATSAATSFGSTVSSLPSGAATAMSGAQRYSSSVGRPSTDNIADYVAQAAALRGIDPTIAIRVANTEGGVTEPARRGTFATGSSWWPFQLHYGGKGYEYLGTTAGMGNSFTAMTGWAPGDPAAWKDSVDFALDVAAKSGWGQWYGAAGAGIGNFQGISRKFGGMIPGALGQPMTAMVHGGEMVLTPGQQAALLHGSAGGGQIVINVNAPVYGVNDMESVVIGALDRAQRRGRL